MDVGTSPQLAGDLDTDDGYRLAEGMGLGANTSRAVGGSQPNLNSNLNQQCSFNPNNHHAGSSQHLLMPVKPSET